MIIATSLNVFASLFIVFVVIITMLSIAWQLLKYTVIGILSLIFSFVKFLFKKL